MLISATAAAIWQIILNPDHTYGKAFGGGALAKTDWKQGSEVLWTDSEGNPGAKGLVIKHDKNHYLQVDMYDDIDAKPGSSTGEYSEKISLEKSTDGGLLLNVEAGPLARKYLPTHSAMWDEAVKIVKTLAEK